MKALLYADDIVILGDSDADVQRALTQLILVRSLGNFEICSHDFWSRPWLCSCRSPKTTSFPRGARWSSGYVLFLRSRAWFKATPGSWHRFAKGLTIVVSIEGGLSLAGPQPPLDGRVVCGRHPPSRSCYSGRTPRRRAPLRVPE